MNTKTRFKNMFKKMVLPFIACGVMGVTGAYAQGDIIGFYSPSANSSFTAPGATVEFTIRLYGTIVVSNLFNTTYAQPEIRMEVGSDGSSSTAYATLIRSEWTHPPFNVLNRTDLTFSYTIRPGDMADPLKIFGTAGSGFTIVPNQCWIYKAYSNGSSSNVTWKVDNNLYNQPGDNGIDSGYIVQGDIDLSGQNIRITTLSFDDANSPITLIARQPSTLWRIKSGATNSVPVKVMVWTPQTNVLQIGSIPGQALEVTIPAGQDFADFAIKGLDTNAIPTLATVYAQRPSDFAKNGTVITNFISRQLTIEPPGAPTISLEFLNGQSTMSISETNEVETGLFRIVLSESSPSRVYVDFSIAHQPNTTTNIVITPQPGGFFVNAGQERSVYYPFSAVNGTKESSRAPYVRVTPSATNTTKYTMQSAGVINVGNIPPTVQWYPPAIADENTPVAFEWSDLIDVDADLARGVAFKWNFGDGPSITQTNFTTSGIFNKTYVNVGNTPRSYTVTLTITDADGGVYTLPSHTIVVSPAPKPANVAVVVDRADFTYLEGDTTAKYRVVLSVPALQNTIVSLVGTYVTDSTSSDDTLTLTVTNNIFIATGLTSSVPYTMTLKDGTAKTASGILITPTITNAAAQAQYPGVSPAIVVIQNVAPGIDTVPTCQPTTSALAPYNAIELGKPFGFRYKATDIVADVNGTPPISVQFQFEDGTTKTSIGANGTVTNTFMTLGAQTVTMVATDKDGGERTVSFPILVVPPLPPPAVTVVDYPVFIAENDTTAKQLTIMLSQTPVSAGITDPVTVYLDVTPANSALNGAVTIPASVIFYSSQSTKQVNFTVQDGTLLSQTAGFTVTPRIVAGQPGSTLYQQFQPGQVLVQNVAPVFQQPIDGSTNTVATVGQPRTFTWSIRDVTADLPTMNLFWDWGDGTTSTTTGGSGTTTHTYNAASPQVSVTVRATDKDGYFSIISFYVTVKDSKQVIALPIGPNPAGFNGFTGLGVGTIVAPAASPSLWNAAEFFYTFYFSADALTAQLRAIPSPKVPGVKQSYFFAWDGPLAAFQNPLHVTQPLAPAQTIIVLPTGTVGTGGTAGGNTTLNGTMVQVSAIFSIEFAMTDGCGDINQDGIPDNRIQTYFIDPAAAGGTDTALDPIWFVNLRAFNEDEDFLPVYPTGDNQGVLDFRPTPNPNTAADGVAVNAFTAFMEIRGYDGVIGRRQDTAVINGFNDDPLTDPTMNDTDGDTYPDGWEYWFYYQSSMFGRSGSRYNPLNIAQGDHIDWSEIIEAFNPMASRNTYTDGRWREDFDNDGLLDIEELVIGTDPTNWDTDGDIMNDAWEILRGFNPRDGRDGNLVGQNNPDGDYFAISTVARQHLQVVTSNNDVVAGQSVLVITTNHYLVALDAAGAQSNATLTTAYRYGNDATGPWAVGRPVDDAVLTPANRIPGPADEAINAYILHFQVRMENGFDPRVAWRLALPRFGAAYVTGGAPAGWNFGPAERFGPWLPPHAPDTRPFTAIDEYLLMKFMFELQMNGMIGPNGWIGRVDAAVRAGTSTRILMQEAWARFTTHPCTPDTDATPALSDGVPDGWELYVAVAENRGAWLDDNAFAYSPWNAADGDDNRPDDGVSYQEEYWATDSLPTYLNAALYYGAMDPAAIPATGTTAVTIQRPAGHADTYWVNKFWPTDPWSTDTDDDNVADGGERAFVYGNAAVAGGICIAGGGLNPNSVDTDRDALPDAWETQFAGAPVAADGTTTLPPVLPGQPAIAVAMTINDGQDGTVADANKDTDYDGLVSYQEYMTQSLRGYRYDVPDGAVPNDEAVVDGFTGNIGQPMDITFEIGVFFTEVVMEWDQSRLGWPLLAPLWWMRPAGPNGYCSTDPQNPDSDYDNMDDYYEMYHGLNPLLGNGIRADYLDDRVAYAWIVNGGPLVVYNFNWWVNPANFTMDFVQYPWLNGMPSADPDADGLLNLEEMLAVNMPLVENQNTDPSPIWMTDPSNVDSITARFYTPYGYTYYKVQLPEMYRYMFFWPPTTLPYFTFTFEMNEGYDTDNDGVSDKDEQVTNRNSKSDPRDSEDPIRRQAIWFSGFNSAATTPYMYTDLNTVVGQSFADMEQAFRSFTVELWARPEWATNLTEQILIERAFDYGQSDASQDPTLPRLRRNFLIGIAPDGRVFGGFDNAGGHDEHTDSVRLFGEKIVANKWVHLAARMDGRTQKFTLFVNGVSQGEMSTSLIPATGLDPARYYPTVDEAMNIVTRSGTLIMGAANIELVSLGIGIGWELPFFYDAMTWGATWLGYEKFYRGWMDEVRVWDGARSNQEINDNYRKRFTREDLLANRTLILEQLNDGAARNALSTNNFLSPILINYYTFNNLFSAHEEQYVAQVPRGFNSTAVNANRPYGDALGAMVNWWDQCEVKNTVYNNWHYLPWIENVAAHLPRVSISTNGTGGNVFVNDNSVSDSIYWTRRSAGNLTTQNSFPNNNNPYGFTYETTQAIDLLPIGDAWAKQCVDFWDDLGATGNWLENSGTTDDGLPTWWIALHGTTGTWTDLYNGTNSYYKDNGMTNGEAYQRDLAKGMLPSATNTVDYVALYAQTADSNGDGMPDWWKRMYGLDIMDKDGESGSLGDPDRDALSNYAEYQITEVYKFRYSSPLKFKTNPQQPLSDYFMKPVGGKLIMGAMFSDHDFIEGWWEQMYAPNAANPYIFDSKTDYDSDGWSNWAEARYSQAISTARPDLREQVMVNGITTFEYPVPIVDTRLNYKGIQASGEVVIQAFSTPSMDGYPDATWNIAFGQAGVQANTIPLGFYANKIVRTRLSPGSVVPGTVQIQLTDTWTGEVAPTGFDMNGIIYSMLVGNIWEPIGTINYITGEMVLDMGYFENINIIVDQANYPAQRDSYVDSQVSYFEMIYDTKLPNGWPQHIYLGRAATGALKEGKNYFYAFIDVDGNGAWDAGEPAGLGTPFETDIGWDENALDIQLTDYTPNNLRLSLTTGLRSEDVIFGTGVQAGGGNNQAPVVGYKRVRIVRASVQTSSFTIGPIFDKTVFGRDYIHEGDLMTMPSYEGYGLDWGFAGILTPSAVGAIGYKVYVGDNDILTNNTLIASFTNRFDATRAVPTTVSPAHGAYVYSARPTFSWSLTSTYDGYNAFAFEIRRGSSAGPLVYPVTVRQVPLQDTKTGNYIWDAPFYMGDKNVINNSVYYWRVQMLNSKYSTVSTAAGEWSSWKIFRWDVNQPMPAAGTTTNLMGSSSGYGQLRAVVKYFGAATTLADNVVVQAFNNRGFTGFPAAQYTFPASQVGLVTNTSLSATNAIALRGLKPAIYYVRAFIDSNVNGVLDTWESWGYANYYGENKSLYDVRPVEVLASAISPLVTVYIEDSDTDQDWFPDAYEYQLNGNLTTLGPLDSWAYRGDSEINPNLSSSGIIAMMLYMTAGTSEQQDAFFSMAVADTDVTPATRPAVTIQSLNVTTGGTTLNWALTPGQPAQSDSLFVQSLLGVAGTLSDTAVKTYTYRVKYSASLATPRSNWEIVKEDTVTVDADGTETITSVLNSMPAAGTSGFFFVEITE
jgi:hypothetical protein